MTRYVCLLLDKPEDNGPVNAHLRPGICHKISQGHPGVMIIQTVYIELHSLMLQKKVSKS